MSDPAVAALGDQQLDEVDLNTEQPVIVDDQSGGQEKDVSVDGTEIKTVKESSELEGKNVQDDNTVRITDRVANPS